MEDAKKWFEDTVINSGQVQQIKEQVNSTTDEALVHVKRGIAMMEAATSEQVHEAKVRGPVPGNLRGHGGKCGAIIVFARLQWTEELNFRPFKTLYGSPCKEGFK